MFECAVTTGWNQRGQNEGSTCRTSLPRCSRNPPCDAVSMTTVVSWVTPSNVIGCVVDFLTLSSPFGAALWMHDFFIFLFTCQTNIPGENVAAHNIHSSEINYLLIWKWMGSDLFLPLFTRNKRINRSKKLSCPVLRPFSATSRPSRAHTSHLLRNQWETEVYIIFIFPLTEVRQLWELILELDRWDKFLILFSQVFLSGVTVLYCQWEKKIDIFKFLSNHI